MIPTDLEPGFVRQLHRIGREDREVRILGIALADDRVLCAKRELAGRVVQSGAEVRRTVGDACVLAAGRKIDKERNRKFGRG